MQLIISEGRAVVLQLPFFYIYDTKKDIFQ